MTVAIGARHGRCFPGEVAYVWHASLHSGAVIASLEAVGFELREQIIWDKQRPIIGRAHYHWQHEPCWYAVRKGATGDWSGDRNKRQFGRSSTENPRLAMAPKSPLNACVVPF